MTLAGVLARAALLAYPADFRAQFGREIVADIDDDGSRAAAQLLDLLKGALAMRLDSFSRDLTYAWRRLRGAPLFVAIVTLTFALGIGANVAVFSVLDAVVLRPLPFAQPSSLAFVQITGEDHQSFVGSSITDAFDLKAHSHSIADAAATRQDQPTMLLHGTPLTLNGLDVTPNYFSVLGIATHLGRGFAPVDDRAGVRNVVISYELWRKRFDADPSVVGGTITLGGAPYRVVGVLRPGQLLVDANGGRLVSLDFVEAMPQPKDPKDRPARIAGTVVRLAPDVRFSGANAELALVSERLGKLYPKADGHMLFSLKPVSSTVIGNAAAAMWIAFAAVLGILLIACANVGNLLATRWSSRDRELAVRRALGASSQRIAGQLLVETGLLAAIGALAGVAIAWMTLRAMAPMIADALPRGASAAIDAASLLYALALVVAATLLGGLSPLASLRASDLQTVLKSAGRGGDASQRHGLRSALVVAEIALALALVTTSALLARNFAALVGTPLGIRPEGVVVTDDIDVSGGGFINDVVSGKAAGRGAPSRPVAIERELLRRLRALPGVQSAGLAMTYPLGDVEMQGPTLAVGQSYPPGKEPMAWANPVSAGYFRTMGVPIVAGRDFTDRDTFDAAPVVIVNETFVRRYLGGTNPLGTQLVLPPVRQRATIVGVVADERQTLTDPAAPEFYQPTEQTPQPFTAAVLYAPGVDGATIGHEVRDVVAKALPLQQPPDTYTMAQRVAQETKQTRFATLLLGALAVIALLLALAGIFGVVSYSVTQRSREFGVRVALGATASAIVADVLRRAFVLTLAGVAAGLAIAAFAARAIAGQLSSVSPFDPATFAAVVALVATCTLLAALQPALRATRVEPAEALRYE